MPHVTQASPVIHYQPVKGLDKMDARVTWHHEAYFDFSAFLDYGSFFIGQEEKANRKTKQTLSFP